MKTLKKILQIAVLTTLMTQASFSMGVVERGQMDRSIKNCTTTISAFEQRLTYLEDPSTGIYSKNFWEKNHDLGSWKWSPIPKNRKASSIKYFMTHVYNYNIKVMLTDFSKYIEYKIYRSCLEFSPKDETSDLGQTPMQQMIFDMRKSPDGILIIGAPKGYEEYSKVMVERQFKGRVEKIQKFFDSKAVQLLGEMKSKKQNVTKTMQNDLDKFLNN